MRKNSSQVRRELRERLFVKAYVANGFQGAAAARAAGYARGRARITASELLATQRVRDAVDRAVATLAEPPVRRPAARGALATENGRRETSEPGAASRETA